MSTSTKFVHGDVVKVINTGETGTVKEVHPDEEGFIYAVQPSSDPTQEIRVSENELSLVKPANDDETGFAIRYIS